MKPLILKLSALGLIGFSLAACATSSQPASESNMLNQYHWQLQSATDTQKQRLSQFYAGSATPNVEVNFQNDRINIFGSCNNTSGAYHVNGEKLTTSSFISTMKGCPDHFANQDSALGHFFTQQTLQYSLSQTQSPPILTITNTQGQTLQFKGVPTAQNKYGNNVETIFLEVSHQTKPCQSGELRQQCLQVKEVRYNEQGLKTHVDSQWSLFHNQIEGYTHRPDTDTILRIKRYTKDQVAADQSRYAYVLDMVVMQALAK